MDTGAEMTGTVKRSIFLIGAWLLTSLALAQTDATDPEQLSLNESMAEAGSSPVEFVRALEKHLARYPKSTRTAELERALVKAAIENKDERRIILYGERVLAREDDDLQVLDRVTRALLSTDDKESAAKAVKYARRYHELIGHLRGEKPPAGRVSNAQWKEEVERGVGRSLALEARATGNLGKLEEAASLARKSYDAFPSAEAAREIGRWLARLGRDAEAVPHIADAFTIADPKNTDADRTKDRERMGELYRKVYGSEKGLGDLILVSYDRTSALLAARQTEVRRADPNARVSAILDFTLSGPNSAKLELASLKGKAVVFDFWATWCGPCRVQHPLYEQVKQKFKDTGDVVFVSVSTDEDRSLVEPFVRDNQWSKAVYFEDGLARHLQISSIPTTIVLNRRGEVVSRLNGFLPDRFVAMLSERIEEALR